MKALFKPQRRIVSNPTDPNSISLEELEARLQADAAQLRREINEHFPPEKQRRMLDAIMAEINGSKETEQAPPPTE